MPKKSVGWIMAEGKMSAQVAGRAIKEAWRISPGRLISMGLTTIVLELLPFVVAFLGALAINELTQAVAGRPVDTRLIYGPVIAAVVVAATMDLFRELQQTVQDNLNEIMDLELTNQLNRQYVSLDLGQLEGKTFQQLLAKSGFRYQVAYRNLAFSGFRLLGDMVGVIAAAGIIFSINPWFALLLALGTIPAAAMRLREGRALDNYWFRHGLNQRISMNLSRLFEQPASGLELRLNGTAGYLTGLVERYKSTHMRRLIGVRRHYSRLQVTTGWLNDGVRLGLELALIGRVLGGSLAIGTYTFYTNAFSRFTTSINGMLREIAGTYESVLTMRDVYVLLDMRPEIASPADGKRVPQGHVPRIEFRNVSFCYPDAAEPVFNGLDLIFEPGQRVALVGENGAGKSTLIKLLTRLYDPTAGAILVDGVDLRNYNLESWRSSLGVLMQDFNHYPLTARENVTLGRQGEGDDDARVATALKRADAERLIAELPNGLEQKLSRLYDDGTNLSGGQWQRVALARSFYRDAEVLVLDEPTSAVDAQAEAAIFDELMEQGAGKTTIIISRRFSTVRRADVIYVVDAGRIIEHGAHAELMKKESGTYRRLFTLQAKSYQ